MATASSVNSLKNQIWKRTLASRITSLQKLKGESGMMITLSMGFSSQKCKI